MILHNGVRLLSVLSYYNKEQALEPEYTHIRVHAKNIGLPDTRMVYVHYKSSSSWMDKKLELKRDYSTHSLYTGSINNSTLEFTIRYKTSEGIFWDNNNNENFKVSTEALEGYEKGTVGGNVGLVKAKTTVQWFSKYGNKLPYYGIEGMVFVKTLGHKKDVGLRVSIDGWKSWKDIPAVYDKPLAVNSLIEIWKIFPAYICIGDAGEPDFSFVVYYNDVDRGVFYWDNNFGENYSLKKVADAEVR